MPPPPWNSRGKSEKKIKNTGHIVGLHSHTHPTSLHKLSYNKQKNEYNKNLLFLSKKLNTDKDYFKCMSHPCGNYNKDTMKILKKMGIKIGFNNSPTLELNKNSTKNINYSNLQVARIDSSNFFL